MSAAILKSLTASRAVQGGGLVASRFLPCFYFSARNSSRRNPENKYPPGGRIRVPLGSDEPHPSEAKNLAQRLKEIEEARSPVELVDIGLPENVSNLVTRSERLEFENSRKKDADAWSKKAAEIDVFAPETTEKLIQDWMRASGPFHLRQIGEHYGIFRDLFGPEYYFYPRVSWNVRYACSSPEGDLLRPVYFGNYLKPSEASTAPEISITTEDPDSLWCVALTNPDGHFTKENSEYLHYLVGNIRGGDISTGEVLCRYLQPFPPKGVGYHRFVFVLYRQKDVIDFSKWRLNEERIDLSKRTFSTLEFYSALEDQMTPASFAFFQACYDRSLTRFFQETLEMREPIYEYEFPKPNQRPTVRYPITEAFNLYLDRHKHPQEINKEVLLLRLKGLDPFLGEPKPLKYPLAHKTPWNMPSWLKKDLDDRAMKEGKYKDL